MPCLVAGLKKTLQNGVIFHGGNSRYCAADKRNVLTSTFGWTVTDGGTTTNCGIHPPTAIHLSSNAISLSTPINTTVGILSATDADANDNEKHYFELVSGVGATDNARYKIVEDTLKLAAVAPSAATTHSIRIQVTDKDGAMFEQTFTIIIMEEEPVGIGIEEENNSVRAYPNPVKNSSESREVITPGVHHPD